MASFISFLRDVIGDVKASWRFRVAILIWVPLVICSLVAVVRFGIRHTLSAKYELFKTTFIPQSSLNYPDIEIYFNNQPTRSSCTQYSSTLPSTTGLFCPDGFTDPNHPNIVCFKYGISRYSASMSNNGGQQGNFQSNSVYCNFTFNPSFYPNVEMYLLLPGGWNTSSTWNYANPVFLRPNKRIGISLMEEEFFIQGQRIVNWIPQNNYEDSEFYDGSSAYSIVIRFDIPFTSLQVNWLEDGFDSWFLLCSWGGIFFFFYCLYLLSFNLLKFILPNDSRLLRSAPTAS